MVSTNRAVPHESPDLQSLRIPAQAAIADFLRGQSDAVPRSGFQKLLGLASIEAADRERYDFVVDEKAVAARLAHLGAEWSVFHSVELADAARPIDHLVVGPAGVFAVTTRRNGAADIGDSVARDYLRARRHIREAELDLGLIKRLLSATVRSPVRVTGVIVEPVGDGVWAAPPDVMVVPRDLLVGWLRSRDGVLTPGQVGRFADAADDPRTWRRSPVQVPAPRARHADLLARHDLDARFSAFQRRVDQATRVRRLWTLGGAAVIATGVILAATELIIGVF